MPKPVVDPLQVANRPPETSDYPDLISDSTVAFAMCKAVPEIIDELTDSAQLDIKYGSLAVENGMVLGPDATMDEPEVEIRGTSGTFTLMAVDPDVPTPHNPKLRSYLHWLVINIPTRDVPRGELVVEYTPPEPGKGKHRLLFLLFKQDGRVTCSPPKSRAGFQVRAFAKEHNLGQPAGGLFVWTTSDEP